MKTYIQLWENEDTLETSLKNKSQSKKKNRVIFVAFFDFIEHITYINKLLPYFSFLLFRTLQLKP